MADTVEQIILDVQTIVPDADPSLARMWVRDSARRLAEVHQWSWQLRKGMFVLPASVTNVSLATTVSTTAGSDVVTFAGAVASPEWIGRQFRVSDAQPIYDIVDYVDANRVKVFPEWGGTAVAGAGFTIAKSRLELPADCLELLSVVSPSNRWQLHLNVPQEILDGQDPGRTRSPSNPSLLSPLDYSAVFAGRVTAPILVTGTGTKPWASGTYTGQSDALFTVQVTTGGIGGVAVFKWKKGEDAFVTGVVSDGEVGNALSDGVVVRWPATSTFTINDVFVVRATANRTQGNPRVELYPFSSSATTLSYWYVARQPDITDDGIVLPGALAHRGDILREKALEFAAAWHGTEDRPNPYRQINRRDYHAMNWLQLVNSLARQDNALFQRNVLPAARMPWAPWPFYSGRNLQEYDPVDSYPTY